ncbi:hypothetical protein LshimejAT787_1103690 [Lyophyllum shimeji]|uniref:Uncharacterized protein n=1 Tax=Lyophyllum shimeji TaxID=47721 RepID=A0A9P3UP52_LYOSH|nr:hypothetical protein LshimejAT787_1103690 [Lyophyllum shimeji]
MSICSPEKPEDAFLAAESRVIAGSLRQTTSKHTGRYGTEARVQPEDMCIQPAMFFTAAEPVPSYLPPQWSAHVHPEGQLYFYRQAALRIVTEAYIYDRDTMEKLTYWIKEIEDLIPRKQILLTDDVELFLQIEGDDCAYYFVDHRSRTQFWLDVVDTDDLGLLPAVSPSHLRLALHELYWMHVEYFPMHFNGLTAPVVDELTGVFSHALADHMTSRNSTFPYAEADCAKFLKLLKTARELRDGHITCFIARLWHLVYRHRFSTHYGEQHARLSRDQPILVDTSRESRRIGSMTSLLTFKTSDAYVARLNDIYTDHLVYAHQWQPFMAKCLKDWGSWSHFALSSLVLHLLLCFIPSSRLLSIFSASCLGASMISSIFLVHRHDHLENATATEAMIYLNGVRSDNFKFQLVAFAYSLPKALYFWGLTSLTMNCILAIAISAPACSSWILSFLGLLSLCLFALLAFQDATSSRKILRLPKLRWRRVKTDETLQV